LDGNGLKATGPLQRLLYSSNILAGLEIVDMFDEEMLQTV
jgi:hypothetical protein